MLQAVDRFQQRHRWLAFAVASWKKFSDDQAGNLAALIWPRSLFPPPLTEQDLEAYRLYAQAEQRRPELDIEVRETRKARKAREAREAREAADAQKAGESQKAPDAEA